MKNNLSVLVCSCDRYQDIWDPFFKLFFRYWQDCPFPVYLISNHLSYDDDRVVSLKIGDDIDWSTSFRTALMRLQTRNVLVVMEDYLLRKPVSTQVISDLTMYMERQNAVCIRLYPDPGPDRAMADRSDVGEILANAEFRVSLQAAIWNREALVDLINPGESGWDFEVQGTKRSTIGRMPYLAVNCSTDDAPFNYYCTGVVRGYWMPGAVRLCAREGIELNLSVRKCAWMRGWIREQPIFLPARKLYVGLRRALGMN